MCFSLTTIKKALGYVSDMMIRRNLMAVKVTHILKGNAEVALYTSYIFSLYLTFGRKVKQKYFLRKGDLLSL